MNTVFVTCIFNGLSTTPYGGRNRDNMYKDSLSSIDAIGVPIYCFTFPSEVEQLQKYFDEERNCKHIRVMPFDILAQEFHEPIMEIKNMHPEIYFHGDEFWKNRCPELMWSKTRMINTVADIVQNQTANIYWIDAGLSNASIMRHKYFPRASVYDHYNSVGLFTPKFPERLNRRADGKIYAMLHTRPNNQRIPEHYNKNPYTGVHTAMIAGLFGGDIVLMKQFCQIFEEHIIKMLDSGVLFSEESAYTGMVNDYPELFTCVLFDTFYNEDWGAVYDGSVSMAQIMDELVE